MLLLCSSGPLPADSGAQAPDDRPTAERGATYSHQRAFLDAHPGTAFSWSPEAGRIERVFGPAFSHGDTGEQSAETFRLSHARMFGAEPQDIVPVGPFSDGRHVQPIMYEPETDTYKFTGYFYTQERDGVPVFRSALKLLVRNENQNPMVLASANLRDLGGFQVEAAADAAAQPASSQAALARVQVISEFAGAPQVASWRRVIWAGVGEMDVEPRLADEFVVDLDVDKWLVITDARTAEVLYEDHLICFIDIEGTVEGLVTDGIGAEQCEDEVPKALPYAEVTNGLFTTYCDENGDFVMPAGSAPLNISARLDGPYFDCFDWLGGPPATDSELVTPPGPAYLLLNEANDDEKIRSQVNGYREANICRDFILKYNPSYPTISTETDFPVNVNRTDGYCPGNAWYSPPSSINFCLSGGGHPNTAWTAVIYHEYGHHLVNMGGSGQSEYGEGMGDSLAALILDDPCTGLGFYGPCDQCLRNADNDCLYLASGCSTCGSAIHSCGQLLSGCVWSTRNYLTVTEPDDYIDILSAIAINAVLVHSGGSITPSITVDYLTLDDDDSDILNGTPHYNEINSGFSDHDMPGPPLALLTFDFPEGLPDMIAPAGGTTIPVHVSAVGADPQPGTGILHVDTGGGYTEIPMGETAPNQYEAVFPASDCGSSVPYYFSAETTTGGTQLWPPSAPGVHYSTLSAVSIDVALEDDFETNQGWVAENLGATSGDWQRGVPVDDPGWQYDPPSDGDGSGQAYVTQNQVGNTDVDDGAVRLTSPVMDMTGGNFAVAYEYYLYLTNSSGVDKLLVEMSDNGDAGPWRTVANHTTDGGLTWRHHEISQQDMENAGLVMTANMKIRYTANDGEPQSINEAGVDGFKVFAIGCGDEVPGDVDGNGVVDVIDFLALLAAWGPCPDPCPPSCAADFDDNCQVDVLDFLIQLANWS
ncbi:MAG: hypothetical protein ACYTF2_12945 [Planctomycetota bacterium]|jgi:hypothetical protein